MSISSESRYVSLNLNIGNQLTATSCGHVVVEILKFMAYQRLQIPYTYQWLKSVVTRKKNLESSEKQESFRSTTYYRTASSALESLDFILKSLSQEINCPNIPEEVCIIFGSTPVTCKEVYRIILPVMFHNLQCQSHLIASDQKIQRNVFKALVTSDKLNQVFVKPLPPTNLYVLLKKKDLLLDNNNFVLASDCRLPRTSKMIIINLRSDIGDSLSCCANFKIFGDGFPCTEIQRKTEEDEDFNEIESTDVLKWYQSIYVMKGFKDCVVNGSSIANTWLDL